MNSLGSTIESDIGAFPFHSPPLYGGFLIASKQDAIFTSDLREAGTRMLIAQPIVTADDMMTYRVWHSFHTRKGLGRNLTP